MLGALQIPFFNISMDTDLCCASSVSCDNTVVNQLAIVGFFQIENKLKKSQWLKNTRVRRNPSFI